MDFIFGYNQWIVQRFWLACVDFFREKRLLLLKIQSQMVATRFFDEIIDFLTSCPPPEAVVAYKPSVALQGRADALLEKNRRDELSEAEKQELDYFMVIEHLMRLAKARARKRLSAHDA